MAYNIKDVFYLDTSATIAKATAGGGSAQLDLSAYIDPIARGRTKGTGLAVYKAHFTVLVSEDANELAPMDTEAGILNFSLQAGAGLGDIATGGIQSSAGATASSNSNSLNVAAGNFYGGTSYPGAMSEMQMYLEPSTEVPYVIVRDNVCLTYVVSTTKKFVTTSILSCRLEVAQISLDQATLNQLLRTQTV